MAVLVTWIIVGLIAGWLASSIMHRRRGLFGNVLLGLLGAFVGGLVFSLLGISGATSILGGIFIATIGAVIVLSVVGR